MEMRRTARDEEVDMFDGEVREGMESRPREVVEIVGAARAMTDTTERIGSDEFGVAAAGIGPTELAWVIDRLDDVRQAVAELLDELAEAAEQAGADPSLWRETLGDLESAGDGLSVAIRAMDPDGDRWDLSGQRVIQANSERR